MISARTPSPPGVGPIGPLPSRFRRGSAGSSPAVGSTAGPSASGGAAVPPGAGRRVAGHPNGTTTPNPQVRPAPPAGVAAQPEHGRADPEQPCAAAHRRPIGDPTP